MRRPLTTWLPILALAALAGAPALATPITPSAFQGGQSVESFEGLAVGPNVTIGLGQSLLQPGMVSAFTFASGVVLSSPIPNPGVFNEGAFVHDFALGADVQNGWGGARIVNDAGDVPFGTAYLGAFDPGAGTASVELSFATGMDRVGAYFSGATGTTLRLDVYGAGGALLESRTMNTVALAQWPTNFLGIENLAGIRRIVFTGRDFGIDGLTFEPSPIAVPEPGTLPAFALGLVGLLGLAVQGRRPARIRVR
jgi:hypothetical protein